MRLQPMEKLGVSACCSWGSLTALFMCFVARLSICSGCACKAMAEGLMSKRIGAPTEQVDGGRDSTLAVFKRATSCARVLSHNHNQKASLDISHQPQT